MPSREMTDHNPQIALSSYLFGWLVTGSISVYGYFISLDLDTLVKISAIVTPFILFGLGKAGDYAFRLWSEKRNKLNK